MREREIIVTEEDGTRRTFRNAVEAAAFYDMKKGAVLNRARGMVKGEKRKFEYGEVQPKEKPVKQKKVIPWNVYGYDEIPYETIGSRVCITVCEKYHLIKVGSVRCKACHLHRGQNRELHLVACGTKKE